jgi:hypothetical protein
VDGSGIADAPTLVLAVVFAILIVSLCVLGVYLAYRKDTG